MSKGIRLIRHSTFSYYFAKTVNFKVTFQRCQFVLKKKTNKWTHISLAALQKMRINQEELQSFSLVFKQTKTRYCVQH